MIYSLPAKRGRPTMNNLQISPSSLSPTKNKGVFNYSEKCISFLSKFFAPFPEKEFNMMTTLVKYRHENVLERAEEHLESSVNTHYINNCHIISHVGKACSCIFNETFSTVAFYPVVNENDFSSWSKLSSVLNSRKCAIGYTVLLDRKKYHVLWNHIFTLYVSEFLKMSPLDIALGRNLLVELYEIQLLHVKTFHHCQSEPLFCVRSLLNKSMKLKFIPQMFSTTLRHDIGPDTRVTFATMVKKLDEMSTKITDEGLKVNLKDTMDTIQDISSRVLDKGIEVKISPSESFASLLHSLKEVQVQVTHEIGSAGADVMNKLTSTMSDSLNSMEGAGSFICSTLKQMTPLIITLLVVGIFPSLGQEKKVVLSVVIVIASLLFPYVKDHVIAILNKVLGISPQSKLDIVDDLLPILSTVLFGKDVCKSGIHASFKKLKDYGRLKVGVSSFLQDVGRIAQKFLDFVLEYFGKEKYIFFQNDSDLLGSYLEDCETFISAHSLDSHLSFEDGKTLAQLETRYSELNKVLNSVLDRQKLYYAKQALEPYVQKKRASSWFGQANRIEPVAIILVGDSHIGKSTVMQALIHEVTARVIDKERLPKFLENPGSEIFSWNWERQHADGYNRQFVTTIDDIGCTVDVAGDPNNIFSAVIKMVNSTPFNLNMAELTSKADSFFASEFVWMTSNRNRWSLNSMFYNEAFVNRLRLGISVILKEGFLPPREAKRKYENFEHLQFDLVAFDKNGMQDFVVKENIGGYEDVREYIINFYDNTREKGEELNDNLQRLMRRGEKMRPQMIFDMNDIPNCLNPLPLESLCGYFLSTALMYCMHSKLIDPWIQNFLYDKLTKAYYDYVDINGEVDDVRVSSQSSLDEALGKKPMLHHYVSCCECPLCTPHLLLLDLQKLAANFVAGVEEIPDRFLNCAWCLGLAQSEDMKIFGQALFFFICRKEYDAMCQAEDSMSSSLGPRLYRRGQEFIDRMIDICSSWCASEPVPICFHKVDNFKGNFKNNSDFAIYTAYCISFYVKRLTPNLKDRSLKSFLKKTVAKPTFIEKIRNKVPIMKTFLIGFTSVAAAMTISYQVHKQLNNVVSYATTMRGSSLLKNDGKIDNFDIRLKNFFDRTYILTVRHVVKIGGVDRNMRAELVIRNMDALLLFMQFQRDVNWEPERYIKVWLDENEEPEILDLQEHELYCNFDEEDGRNIFRLWCGSPHRCSCQDTMNINGVNIAVMWAQSSSGLKNDRVITRPSNIVPPMKKQSIDISKFMVGYDKANRDIGRKVINRNVLVLYIPNRDCSHLSLDDYKEYLLQNCRACSVLMIGGRIGILNDHVRNFIEHAMENNYVTMKRPLMLIRSSDPLALPQFWYPDPSSSFYSIQCFENSDISVVKLPEDKFHEFANIKKYFVTKDMPKSSTYQGILYVPGIKCQIESTQTFFTAGISPYDDYDNGEVWIYPVATQPGDCGSLLTICDKFSGSKKICGFHIAGDGQFRGASFPLFQEEIEAILKHFQIKEGLRVPIDDCDYKEDFMEKQGKYPYAIVGEVDMPSIPFRSRLRKAPLHDIGDVTYTPVSTKPVMVNGEKIVPTVNALWKNVPATQPLNGTLLEYLYDLMLLDYNKVSVVSREKRLLTFEESVLGIEGDPYLRAMTRGTSAGIPYKYTLALKNHKGKQILFGKDEIYDLQHPGCLELKQDVMDEIRLMEQGERNVIPYEVSEKDETLPIEKVKEGKIRLFAVNSALGGSLKRIYGGQFRSWFAHNRIYNGSAIGINVYSLEWDRLVKYLLFGAKEPTKPTFIAMDVRKFDGTISRQWMYMTYRIVAQWYDLPEKDKNVQMSVFESHLHSFHIFRKLLFERNGSQSSGDDYTALLNTITSQGYFWYACLLLLSGDNDGVCSFSCTQLTDIWQALRKDIRLVALGDDILVSVRPDSQYYGIVTEENLIKVYKQFGVQATTDSKGGTNYAYRYLNEVTFLKRRSVYDPEVSRYVGRLELTSIFKSLHWMRDNDPQYEAYRLTVLHALEELSLHPENVFQQYVAEVVKRARERINFLVARSDQKWLKMQCLAREDYF